METSSVKRTGWQEVDDHGRLFGNPRQLGGTVVRIAVSPSPGLGAVSSRAFSLVMKRPKLDLASGGGCSLGFFDSRSGGAAYLPCGVWGADFFFFPSGPPLQQQPRSVRAYARVKVVRHVRLDCF